MRKEIIEFLEKEKNTDIRILKYSDNMNLEYSIDNILFECPKSYIDQLVAQQINFKQISDDIIFIQNTELTSRYSYSFNDLEEIMKILRGENGCAWDKVQTHLSIKQNLIEETYELVEAIDLKNKTMMQEEIGDVLLQVVFHAAIASDEQEFNINDVLNEVCNKLISRHTHIFGSDQATSSQEALNFWNKAKLREKEQKSDTDRILQLCNALPSLMYANKSQKIAADSNFDFVNNQEIIEKIQEEITEFLEANSEDKNIEGGDIIFSVVNLLRINKVEPETALRLATEKFIKRYIILEKYALKKYNKKISELDINNLNNLWDEIKLKYSSLLNKMSLKEVADLKVDENR